MLSDELLMCSGSVDSRQVRALMSAPNMLFCAYGLCESCLSQNTRLVLKHDLS